eukprot:TRINITY_DN22493_c0_g1_i1.p1 TRINITY_DN22493_c0_g1~~TRINITY_DN22493_c0_g1_i1.p1  ORF type:complete len:768 (+),score=233.55 TRINITY_DN22493_c0_g1_i1:58-2361(+)
MTAKKGDANGVCQDEKEGDENIIKKKYTYTLEESLHLKQKVNGVNLLDELECLKEVLAMHGIQKGKDSLGMGKVFEERCFEANQPLYSRSGFGTSSQGQAAAPLKLSENGYSVMKNTNDLTEDQKLKKTVHGILNKLTPEKYDILSRQIIDPDTKITSNTKYMELTIEQIFDRAVVQPSFCEMYADLSKLISKAELSLQKQQAGQGAQKAPASVFRRLLVETVQKEYNKHKKKGMKEGEEGAEEKKRKLGNIQFVGELYRKAMLTDKVMHLIITEILYGSKAVNNDTAFMPEGGDLEVLCRLLNTTGKELEARAPQVAEQPGAPDYAKQIDVYFERLEQLTTRIESIRIKMLILNLCDSRKNGWPVCHKESKAKKLDDFERESEENEKRKLEGIRLQNFTGDKTAWGQAAELHVSLSKTGSVGDFASLPRQESGGKEKEKKKKDDEWQMAGGKKKAAEKGPGSPVNAAKPSGGVFASLNSPIKKKKKPSSNSASPSTPSDCDRLTSLLKELSSFDSKTSLKVKTRALECMEEPESEWKACCESDLKEFEEERLSADVKVMVVHEAMRGVAVGRVAREREDLVKYIKYLHAEGYVTETDVVDGVAAFISTAVNTRLVEEVPNSYGRVVDALKSLPLAAIFEAAYWYTSVLYAATPADEVLVDSPRELFSEIHASLWVPLHTPLPTPPPSLESIFSLAYVKPDWIKSESTYILRECVAHLIKEGGVTTDEVESFIGGLDQSGDGVATGVSILRSVLDNTAPPTSSDEDQ